MSFNKIRFKVALTTVEGEFMKGNTNLKFGLGSASLLLVVIGVLFSFTFGDINYGDMILNSMGLSSWSQGNSGTHYTIYYSLIFYISSIILGYKYKDDFGAKIGRRISIIIGVLITLGLIFSVGIL